jgi:hypothetical protein
MKQFPLLQENLIKEEAQVAIKFLGLLKKQERFSLEKGEDNSGQPYSEIERGKHKSNFKFFGAIQNFLQALLADKQTEWVKNGEQNEKDNNSINTSSDVKRVR